MTEYRSHTTCLDLADLRGGWGAVAHVDDPAARKAIMRQFVDRGRIPIMGPSGETVGFVMGLSELNGNISAHFRCDWAASMSSPLRACHLAVEIEVGSDVGGARIGVVQLRDGTKPEPALFPPVEAFGARAQRLMRDGRGFLEALLCASGGRR